jgi:predicted transcriptional regulator
MPRFDWSQETLELLGSMPDPKVASQLGLTASAVRQKRTRLGIPQFAGPRANCKGRIRPNFKWTAEAIALLGTMSDPKVGARLGLGSSSVKWKRDALGIPPHTAICRISDSTRVELLKRVGTTSDRALAYELGISQHAVSQYRAKQRVAAKERYVPLPAEAEAQFGEVADAAIARRFGGSPQTVGRKRRQAGISRASVVGRPVFSFPNAAIGKLGILHDEVIAAEIGRSKSFVAKHRRSLGIAAAPRPHSPRSISKAAQRLLGTLPDSHIAKLYQLNTSTVRATRLRLKIASWQENNQMAQIVGSLSALERPEGFHTSVA